MYDIIKLHSLLKTHAFQGKLPKIPKLPSQWAYARQKVINPNTDLMIKLALERRNAIQDYLRKVLIKLNMYHCSELCEFLEISGCSIKGRMGWKGREGFMEMKTTKLWKFSCIPVIFGRWKSNWVILRDSYLMVVQDIHNLNPSKVYLYNSFTSLDEVYSRSMNPLKEYQIAVQDSMQRIDLRGDTRRQLLDMVAQLKMTFNNSPWCKSNRFGSFAPIRTGVKMKWYVDGAGYFHDVCEAILHAKRTIYIADWWLSPEFHLRRPPSQYPEFRIDRLLQRKAKEGVMIYVALFKELTVSLPNNSAHTKSSLKKLHPNIKVQRHPDHIQSGTFFWAHHEKIVVVDNEIGFLGGLDICFGRFDDPTHRLSDYRPNNPSPDDVMWPGQDYANSRLKDHVHVEKYQMDLIDRKQYARMPWHDISVSVSGAGARDLARHFIQRWNFVKSSKAKFREHIPYLLPEGEYARDRDNHLEGTGNCKMQMIRSSAEWSSGVQKEQSIYNAYITAIQESKHFIYIENQFFVTKCTEDPHNLSPIKNQIGLALVERIKKAHYEQTPFFVIVIIPLMPAFANEIHASDANVIRLVMHGQYVSISRGGQSLCEELAKSGIDPNQYIKFYGLRCFDLIPMSHKNAPVNVTFIKDLNNANNNPSTETTVNNGDSSGSSDSNTAVQNQNYPLTPAASEVILHSESETDSSDEEPEDDGLFPQAFKDQLKRLSKVKFNLKPPKKDKLGTLPAISQSNPDLTRTDSNGSDIHKTLPASWLGNGQYRVPMPTPLEHPGPPARQNSMPLQGERHHHSKPSHGSANSDPHNPFFSPEHCYDAWALRHDSQLLLPRSVRRQVPNDWEQYAAEHGPQYPFNTPASPRATIPQDSFAQAQYVTEQVYIHSKLMIVDDRVVICGSANLNDRSTRGNRDSEIAVHVEDQDLIDSTMGGLPFKVGKFAHSLRTTLFKEHVGLLDDFNSEKLMTWEQTSKYVNPAPNTQYNKSLTAYEIVRDPLSKLFKQHWFQVSENNTKAYREVFRCVPDDTVRNWTQYKEFVPDSMYIKTGHPDLIRVSPQQVEEDLGIVRGHLVEFPTKFLEEENLSANIFSAENVLPLEVFL
jgi:phosphatidylserine/phosphatidylglycerophosphate/cardiolipin synthase-like enzyme